jgi:hypothetical protein
MNAANGDLCKWVDENGTVHYAENCPDKVDSEMVVIRPPPSEAQIAEAETRAAETKKRLSERKSSKHSESENGRSLSLEQLGPLPVNTISNYLITRGTGINFGADGRGKFTLSLEARNSMPSGAYIEVHFPVPGSAGQKQVVEKSSVNGGDPVLLFSDESSGFKCWNYQIEVFVYEDESKKELLDVHRQTIQSRFDSDLIHGGIAGIAKGMSSGGTCPSSDKREVEKMSLAQLDALCESEREKRLKPERDRLINDCIKRGDKQDEWCITYYADWGDARRISRDAALPALYYNLPECVASREAREKAKNGR